MIFVLPALAQNPVTQTQTGVSGSTSNSGTTSAAPSSDDRYRIGYQDVLDIQVFKHPEYSGRQAVNPAGTIGLFKIDKPITAVCKTDEELAADIAKAYEEKILRNPEVRVFVAEQKSQPISVIGAVEKPGNIFASKRIQLIEALSQVGGPNKEAGTRLVVFRTGNSASCKMGDPTMDTDAQVSLLNFKIRDVQEGRSTLWMKPGDVVSVLDADVVYMYGNVMKQGSLRIREPLTLTQAIASAEGLKPATKRDHIRILRQKGTDGERVEMVFDLTQIDKGKVKDPFLEPGDIVAVSEDKVRSILNGIRDTVKSTVPTAIYRM